MTKGYMKLFISYIALFAIFSFILFGGNAMAGPQSIDASSYPEIGDDEMGQLRWVLSIADQDINDFSNMESNNQYGMTSYRYQIAFMTYFLALEQYHKLPACPEIIRPRMDRLNKRND